MKFWIGEHIRQARVLKGWTQETLGSFIGRKQSYICKVEHGKKDIGFHAALKLFHSMGTQPPPMSDGLRPDRPPSP